MTCTCTLKHEPLDTKKDVTRLNHSTHLAICSRDHGAHTEWHLQRASDNEKIIALLTFWWYQIFNILRFQIVHNSVGLCHPYGRIVSMIFLRSSLSLRRPCCNDVLLTEWLWHFSPRRWNRRIQTDDSPLHLRIFQYIQNVFDDWDQGWKSTQIFKY